MGFVVGGAKEGVPAEGENQPAEGENQRRALSSRRRPRPPAFPSPVKADGKSPDEQAATRLVRPAAKQKRFKLGDRVLAAFREYSTDPISWKPGTIVVLDYDRSHIEYTPAEAADNSGHLAPYQICLDSTCSVKRYVFAPHDTDDCVRALTDSSAPELQSKQALKGCSAEEM